MTAIPVITIVTVFYIIPIIYNRWWFKQAYYAEKGIWNHCRPNNDDWFFMFFPFFNIIVSLHNLFDSPITKPKEVNNKPKLIERFLK